MYLLVNVQQLGPLTAYTSDGKGPECLDSVLNDSHYFKSFPFSDPPIMKISSCS